MINLVNWLEKYLLPWANKIGQVKWLVALRDAFVATVPITLAGSLAVLIKSLVAAAKTQWHWHAFAFVMTPAVQISNIVWRGTFSLFAIYFALTWGYELAKAYECQPLAGGVISLAAFATSIANVAVVRQAGKNIIVPNAFATSQLATTGLFTAIIFGGLGVSIYIICVKLRLVFRVATNVPAARQAAFEALIPGMIAIFVVGSINFLFKSLTKTYFGDWLLKTIQLPLIKAGQGFGMVMLVTFLVQVFWFFGLDGASVLSPILESIWLTAQNANITAAQAGKQVPFIWARGSFNVFAWFGGPGSILVLLIAILFCSKRSDSRMLAKVSLAPSIFNIGEPVIFGLPIVFNPIYFIPFVLAPMINVALAYWVTVLGWVNPVQVMVPSVLPPVISAYFACNYDWRAIVLSLVNMAIAFLLWLPFVLAANKIDNQQDDRLFFNIEY